MDRENSCFKSLRVCVKGEEGSRPKRCAPQNPWTESWIGSERTSTPPSIRDEWHCWKGCTKSEWRNFSSIAAIRIGWKMVCWFYGMMLLSSTCPRPLGRRENSSMKDDLENLSRANNSFCSNGWTSSDFNARFIKTSSIWQESIAWYLSGLWAGRGENLNSGLGRFGKRINAKEVFDNTKRVWIHIPSSRMVQQNCQEETTNSENPLQGGNQP